MARGDCVRVTAHGFLPIAHSAVAAVSSARLVLRKRFAARPAICVPVKEGCNGQRRGAHEAANEAAREAAHKTAHEAAH